MPLETQLTQIHTPQELSAFILLLLEDHHNHPEHWENHDLPVFLEAMAAWLNDSASSQPQSPTWQTFAQILLAGRSYE
jgi:hypothetical protein